MRRGSPTCFVTACCGPDAVADDVAELLKPCPDEWLKVRPISTRINKVAYDRPDVIEPVDA
jgi:putative SOS response-associated peptidase YedK